MLLQALPEFDPTIAEEFGYAIAKGPSFLGIPLIQGEGLLHLLLIFAFNLLVSWTVVFGLYYRKGGRKNYAFTFMLFASAMVMILLLMDNVKLQIGFTLGLFAIFGMIRYRTETVPVREMTYLFVIIALSIINGIGLNVSYAELVLANALIIALIWVCEKFRINGSTATKIILYDRIELIVPERRSELKADLEKRTGLEITALEIGHVDFLRDAAYIKITYKSIPGEEDTFGCVTKPKDDVQ